MTIPPNFPQCRPVVYEQPIPPSENNWWSPHAIFSGKNTQTLVQAKNDLGGDAFFSVLPTPSNVNQIIPCDHAMRFLRQLIEQQPPIEVATISIQTCDDLKHTVTGTPEKVLIAAEEIFARRQS